MDTMESAMRGVARNWGWMLAYGVLLIVIGIFAIMHPAATGLAVGIMLAVSLFVSGAISVAAAFRDAGWQAKTVDVLFGVLALVTGLLVMTNPFGGAASLVWIIGVMFLVSGGFELVSGFRTDHEKVSLILLGVVDLLLGFWATFLMGPGVALLALATLVGIGLVFRGALLAMIAFKARSLSGG